MSTASPPNPPYRSPHDLDLAPVARLPRSVREFLSTEIAGGIVLIVAAVLALVWANSSWSESYETFLHTSLVLDVGSFHLSMDLQHFVNDGLMALFFFVVGLEIKRELVEGELRDPRVAAIPAIAALGGMVVPVAIYLLVNSQAVTPGLGASGGWGIPMATDIAFALGVVALFGSRLPSGLKLFLLTLAIVDDIGAILVIAVFYADEFDGSPLVAAIVTLGAVVGMRRLRVGSHWVFVPLGLLLWYFTFRSGVHPTIAGVVMGLVTPARAGSPGETARNWAKDLDDEPTAEEVDVMTHLARSSVSLAEWLQHRLHPLTSFLIVPFFALVNAGVRLDGAVFEGGDASVVALGIVLGLVVGKLVGISGFTWLAVRFGLGRLPEGMNWRLLFGAAAVAGIGFTVSLFVAQLAFEDDLEVQAAAKTAVLAASVLAAVIGSVLLALAIRAPGGDGSSAHGDVAGSQPPG
ncbi:MAG TPA: Na+/H+ antiporter NhaA [Microthrixaceae bacterium]|nr:Na+/H+ antiporter NhaA [Microthrixaceae bacterium]